jgi:hypothetical protein
VAGSQSLRLVPLLGVPKRDPSRNREMGGEVPANHSKNATTNQKTVSLVVEVLRRDTNEGDGCEGGGQAIVTRAMVTATATVMTRAMAMAMTLVGDEEGKGKSSKGNSNCDEGSVQQRGGGGQGNGDGNKDGRQVDCNGIEEGNGNGNKGGRATKRVMAMATAVVGGKEGEGNCSKIIGVGDEGGWQAKQQGQWQQGCWWANDGNKDGNDGNGNNVGNGDGDEAGGHQRKGKGQGQQGRIRWQ